MTKGGKNCDYQATFEAQKYRDDDGVVVKFYLPHTINVALSLWTWQRQQLPESSLAHLKSPVEVGISVKNFRDASRVHDNVNPEDLIGGNPIQVSEAVHITPKHFQSTRRKREKKRFSTMTTIGKALRNTRKKYFSRTARPC